jgi:hypothetical protein
MAAATFSLVADPKRRSWGLFSNPRVVSLAGTSRISAVLNLNLRHALRLVPVGQGSTWSSNVAELPMSRAKMAGAPQLLPCQA